MKSIIDTATANKKASITFYHPIIICNKTDFFYYIKCIIIYIYIYIFICLKWYFTATVYRCVSSNHHPLTFFHDAFRIRVFWKPAKSYALSNRPMCRSEVFHEVLGQYDAVVLCHYLLLEPFREHHISLSAHKHMLNNSV